MSRLDRDGVEISWKAQGSGPVLLLTHGFGSSAHMWASNVPALAEHHTVVTWDIRGHGDSDYPSEVDRYSAEIATDDMAGLLDAVGAQQATILGMSVGGYLSMLFRVRYPERTSALVLVDTGPGFKNDEARAAWNDFAINRRAIPFEQHGLEALEEGRTEFDRSVHRDASGLARAARGILTQQDDRVIRSLPGVDVPTLVVVGEHDATFLKSCQYMAERIPGAELVVLPDAGHASNMEQPEAFNAAVLDFLARRVDGLGD